MALKRSTTIALTVAVAFFMQNLDTTAVNTAVPAMAHSFGTDVIHLSAGITSYMIALAIFIPVSGWIADRFGTRKVFCAAIVFFIIASVLCGTSQNLTQFVIFRVMQGMAGAMMTPVGRLAVLKSTSKGELVSAMNTITVPALIAPILGPLIGGYLTTYWSWHWIFLLNIPISIFCIILAWNNMPKEKEEKDIKKRFDKVGFILSGLGFAGFMYGVEMFSHTEVHFWIPIVMIIVSVSLIYLNVKYSKHTSNPLIDYSILRIDTYRMTITMGTITRMIIGVAPYLVPLMFQIGFGLSPFESGLLFVATMAGNLSMKTATVWTIRHFPFRNILIVNGILMAFFTLCTAFLLPTTPVWLIVLVMFLSGMTRSMQFTSITTLAFSDVPSDKMTPANSLYSTIQQMSSGLGIAMGAVLLRFSNVLNGGTAGDYTVPDFRLAFIFVSILAAIHLYGYSKLKPDDGNSVRNKK
ncbi:DHA2 family efflux MFS transporter permease subunit [Dysgonomonas sp. 25]|uniref:DHA2 family efflux MFS transporter permease subunit n=1 Tax=Dysgonomonas sp. 25 TaxID=2302933 RepID=UPI0013D69A15|nr:DHA2 family efflux MFS transporter permease subunit [Dysgonomonas sp. 25]NDV67410.1 DHA2 family efflux MFS transporter permease subunit [Dysgonomonas sp. 25]